MGDIRPGVRLALDWGEARIGVAACDPAGTVAYPVATVAARDRPAGRIAALVAEYEPIELVVGLPRSLSGGEGPAAARVRAAAAGLAAALAADGVLVPLRLVDERLSTVTASHRLQQSGRSTRRQRSVIDAAAAVVILEHALAAERTGNGAPGELLSAPNAPD